MPHSHLDAGWLKSYDEYYFDDVYAIFSSVVNKMLYDTEVTYTVGDLAFFQRYYENIANFEQRQVANLVKRGQLEIVHGGLVSPDEACPNYSDVLRNFEAGHDFVKQAFGVIPTVAWQLDPFGHSSAFADLFAEIGFDATVFARMNIEDKQSRRLERDLEFVWQPDFYEETEPSLRKEVFAHTLYDHYSPGVVPHSFLTGEGALRLDQADYFNTAWS